MQQQRDDTDEPQQWDDVAQHYHDHVSRFTSLFANDLMFGSLSLDYIRSCKTILDIGCGPGVFGLNYVKAFPNGVENQTIICTDVAPNMVAKAKYEIESQLPSSYLTKFVFSTEDGATLDGIDDASVSLVVSLFGVFLVPSRTECLKSIRRVLEPNGRFATTTWTCLQGDSGISQAGFGPNFHETIEATTAELTNMFHADAPWKQWGNVNKVYEYLADDFDNVAVQRSIHSVVWPNVDALWSLVAMNPMANLDKVDEATAERAKQKMMDMVHGSVSAGERQDVERANAPVFVLMAANLVTAVKR
ncbi:hypothetical protein MPSEU_000000800 [Mayamaea pseudoterrestris]|nr:hypothetical protein MPSEU_000000800 [Mayamaea pseudoterrestris]